MDRNSDLPEIRITDADTAPNVNQNPDSRPNQDQAVETKPRAGSTDPQGTDGAYEKNTEAKPINIPKPLKPFGVWPRVHFPAEDQYHSSSSSSSDTMTQTKQRVAFAKAIASGEINHGKLRFFCDVCQLNLSRATHFPVFSVFQNFDEREKYRRDIFGKESILPRERSDHREFYEALDAMNSSPLL
ncbi:hypothetical protein H072_6415 [Dactylellina haptotyla CBS 200.50]|uniref:Uncharacterized protein n=1 Tax=Dactylellina haptotyla (strain CBS 200.50) TaxID=1284197 RepID=S8BX81_DACHA|nr:hypothetical protein H072_6415 [Dactylellina haptotyla CBS 200.50]